MMYISSRCHGLARADSRDSPSPSSPRLIAGAVKACLPVFPVYIALFDEFYFSIEEDRFHKAARFRLEIFSYRCVNTSGTFHPLAGMPLRVHCLLAFLSFTIHIR